MLATATRISLEVGCPGARCEELAAPLLKQLQHGYDECSVLELPESLHQWRLAHRTARKRADRATRLGYYFTPIIARHFIDDLYAINTSLSERQGRPMSAAYRERPSASPDPLYLCPRHGVRRYGVLQSGVLRAYCWLYRMGELALVSSILGHGQHLRDDVMWLLMEGVIEREIPTGGFLVYNRWDSGTDGLRYYKARHGFERMGVEWAS